MASHSITCSPRKLGILFLLWATLILPASSEVLVKRPEAADGGPTIVSVSIFLIDLDGVDNAEQTFTANLSLDMRWSDPRLAHGQDGAIVRPIGEVWNPRLQITNQQRLVKTFAETVSILPDGEVSFQQRVWGNFSQPLDLRAFPFDSQHFRLDLVSASYGPDELTLVSDPDLPSGIAEVLSLPDWQIDGFGVGANSFQPNASVPPLAGFRFEVRASRRVGYYLLKVIFPLILIVAMSWIVFWIDPEESGTQISVSVTSMLTLIAYRFMAGGLLPTISYLTRLDTFILISTLLVFITLIAVIVTSALAKSGRLPLARRLDRIARIAFPTAFFATVGLVFIA